MSLFDDMERRRLERESERAMNNRGSYSSGSQKIDATVRFDPKTGEAISGPPLGTPAVSKPRTTSHREGESYVVAGVRLTKSPFGISTAFATGACAPIIDPRDAIRAMFDFLAEQAEQESARR